MELLFLDEALFGDTVLKGKTWNRRLTTKTKLFGGEGRGKETLTMFQLLLW